MYFKTPFSYLYLIVCLLIFNDSWSQSSDIIVYPTLTFYSSDTPTVADLTVKAQNITGTVVWYDQKVGGAQYAPGDPLDIDKSYWAELSGAVINERLQTKIYFANTPVVTEGEGVTFNTSDSKYYACSGQDFTLIGDKLGGIDEFKTTLNGLGFTQLDTGLGNGNTHFISTTNKTWVATNELINGDPNVSSSVGTPGVSMYMLSDTDLVTNQTERVAVLNAINAAGLNGGSYWMGISQFLNSTGYMGIGTKARAEAGWFWEDGTYYNSANAINPSGRDWAGPEPNDYGTAVFNREEDKVQLKQTGWVDQEGNSTVLVRQSGAIIEFNDASGIQWFRNDGSGWVSITGSTSTELTETAGAAGTSIDYRVEATFNGSPKQSATFTVNFASSPSAFNILDNNDLNNPNEEFYVCAAGDTRILKTDIAVGSLNFTWTAIPTGIVNLTPSSNTVTVEGTAPGSVTIECVAVNANGCESSTSITFDVGGLTTPVLPNPYDICGNTGSALPTTDTNGQEIAWYATGDTTTEFSGDPGVNLIDGQAYDVYGVIRDLNGDVVCQSTSSISVTLDLAYPLETDPTLPDPNNGNPGPIEWSLRPTSPGGNYDLRNLGSYSHPSTAGTNRYYTLFRGIDPSTLPDMPYEFKVFRNSDFTDQINGGIQSYNTSNANSPAIVYATIKPNGFDCIYEFGPIYLRDCNLMNLGSEITGGNEICGIGSTIQLNADVTNLPSGYTILWTATPGSPAGNVTFDDATASTVNITGTVTGVVNISYTATDPTGIECETSTSNTFTVTVNPIVTPTFTQVAPICDGDTLSPLPTTSNQGITGSWSPALDNTTTTVYTFTPGVGQCAINQTMTITVNPIVTPTFTQVAAICDGDTLSPLPTTSNEGITGSWSPALDNTTTTVYTFTPDVGQCAISQTMTITVNPLITSTFAQVAAICAGDTLSPLPTTSNEGITGSWSPALDNTTTTVYTFTPDVGQCAINQTMTITVNPIVTPTFTQVAPICAGDTLSPLPTTSNQGITGSWSPALDNTTTTVYTFTPGVGQCAISQTMTITVNPIVTPTFTQVAAICDGDTLSSLPTTSNEGITGSWSPALDNTTTTVYTFTPDVGQCAINQTMTITVVPVPIATGITPASITSVCKTNDMATITADGSTGADFEISWTQNNSNVNIVPNALNEWEITVTALADNATTDITYRITETSTIEPINNPDGCYSEYTFSFEINTPNTPIADAQQFLCESGFVSDLVATVDTANNEELIWLDASDIEIPKSDWATTALISNTIYKAVARNTISSCESNAFSVTTSVESRLTINPTSENLDLVKCDDGTGIVTFNLTVNDAGILGTESASNYDVGYFTDTNRTDRIVDPANFVNTSSPQQTVYIRAFTSMVTDNSCYADAEFTVTNSLVPQITVTSLQSLCDGETLDITVDSSDGAYDYSWSTGETTESILVTVAGIYTVFASNPTTGCTSTVKTIEVISSGAPSIDMSDIRVDVNDKTNSNITIDNSNLGIGDYEFSLDNGSFQDEPIFTNVASGIRVITVRDKNGCGPNASIEIYVFGFPKFFTPNNDSQNDYWQVKGLDTRFYQHADISIFDRYGKLMKVFSSAGQGWNGFYNGANLPASDYWYKMSLTDVSGNTTLLKGHFALIR
jgi:gliding motility-associated-like protein